MIDKDLKTNKLETKDESSSDFNNGIGVGFCAGVVLSSLAATYSTNESVLDLGETGSDANIISYEPNLLDEPPLSSFFLENKASSAEILNDYRERLEVANEQVNDSRDKAEKHAAAAQSVLLGIYDTRMESDEKSISEAVKFKIITSEEAEEIRAMVDPFKRAVAVDSFLVETYEARIIEPVLARAIEHGHLTVEGAEKIRAIDNFDERHDAIQPLRIKYIVEAVNAKRLNK